MRELIVFDVVENDCRFGIDARANASAASLGNADSVVGRKVILAIANRGRTDQPVELGRNSVRIDGDRDDVTRLSWVLDACEQRLGLVAHQVDELIYDLTVLDVGEPHGDALARIGIGQGDDRVDPARIGAAAGIFREEEQAASLEVAKGALWSIGAHHWHSGADERLVLTLECGC